MSRHGLSDDACDDNQWGYICWRGAVASAMRGKRGQAALREIAAALDAMPVKELAAASLVNTDGMCCTLGALGQARGIDIVALDPEDRPAVAKAFGIAEAMAAEIMYMNDEATNDYVYAGAGTELTASPDTAAARRWTFMRKWVQRHMVESDSESAP